jgi:hypothetical protein
MFTAETAEIAETMRGNLLSFSALSAYSAVDLLTPDSNDYMLPIQLEGRVPGVVALGQRVALGD